ncbi:NAD-dependent epimerase/dehydratase family protein [Candidatus Albibeggiatoa sp. nov. NOAA]|uniref:NAD-dependent epimerase/dehydratase family protein n=1 Tax=Candidatus Albibeggiatoa sp. nov. NOAA TaxID=3162724 RepID=UPI00333E580C
MGNIFHIGLCDFNIDGEIKSSYSSVISIFIDKLNNQTLITIFGDGKQMIDFMYVTDIVGVNILVMDPVTCGFN